MLLVGFVLILYHTFIGDRWVELNIKYSNISHLNRLNANFLLAYVVFSAIEHLNNLRQ